MSTSFAALRGLPFGLASPAVPLADASRGPKLLEYLFLGDPAIGAPDGLPDMPSIDDGRPEPRLDGTNGGDGRKGVTGDDAKLLPAPVGDGGIRDDVGDCAGRPGSDGPVPPDSGECWRRDGDGEASDGEPEEMVDDLNAFTEAMGLRIGTPLGDALSCYIQVMVINVNARSPCQKVPPRTELRPCKLSRRIRAASAETSSRDPIDAACLDDVSDKPDIPMPAPERLRVTGRGMLPSLGLAPGLDVPLCAWLEENDPDRVCDADCGVITNLSATERGGERGNDVRRGRLPGEPLMLSRCWFLTSVGVKSGPSSSERKREDNRDSRSSS